MAQSYSASSVEKFPEPHNFGLWNVGGRTFSMHRSLSLVKSAITNNTDNNDRIRRHYKVFEHDGKRWVEIYDIPQGSRRSDQELWQGTAPKSNLGVNEDDLQAAIKSITEGAGNG